MKRSLAVISRTMAAVKSKGTTPEIILGRAMWASGLRYRKQYALVGKPDFVFIKKRIAIFCDGDFWHGNNWKIRGMSCLDEELETYSPYWRAKILKNISRDLVVNKILVDCGWTVLRFWESDIKKDVKSCVTKIVGHYNSPKQY